MLVNCILLNANIFIELFGIEAFSNVLIEIPLSNYPDVSPLLLFSKTVIRVKLISH